MALFWGHTLSENPKTITEEIELLELDVLPPMSEYETGEALRKAIVLLKKLNKKVDRVIEYLEANPIRKENG